MKSYIFRINENNEYSVVSDEYQSLANEFPQGGYEYSIHHELAYDLFAQSMDPSKVEAGHNAFATKIAHEFGYKTTLYGDVLFFGKIFENSPRSLTNEQALTLREIASIYTKQAAAGNIAYQLNDLERKMLSVFDVHERTCIPTDPEPEKPGKGAIIGWSVASALVAALLAGGIAYAVADTSGETEVIEVDGTEDDGELEELQNQLNDQQSDLNDLEQELDEREENLDERESEIAERESEVESAESDLDDREQGISETEGELNERESDVDSRESDVEDREQSVAEREQELDERESEIENREQEQSSEQDQ